jgi:AcrR family transcriptional regulator
MSVLEPSAASPRSRQGAQRQAALMDRIESIMIAEGFGQLTIDALARRLACSKTTLYGIAASREQIVTAVVERFFQQAAGRLEARMRPLPRAADKLAAYLTGIAGELRPAAPAFFADVAAFVPARAAYERNARAAADRVRGLVADGVGAGEFAAVHAGFVGELVAGAITSIQRGDLLDRTGLDAASAYDELATLVLRALAPDARR